MNLFELIEALRDGRTTLKQLKTDAERYRIDFAETACPTIPLHDLQAEGVSIIETIFDMALSATEDQPWRGTILRCYGFPADLNMSMRGKLVSHGRGGELVEHGKVVARYDDIEGAEGKEDVYPTRHMIATLLGIDHGVFERLWRLSDDDKLPVRLKPIDKPNFPPDTKQALNDMAWTVTSFQDFFPEARMLPHDFYAKANDLGLYVPEQLKYLTDPKTAKKHLMNMRERKERDTKIGEWIIKYDKGYAGPYRTRDQTAEDCRNAPELKGLFNRDTLNDLMVSLRPDETRKRRGRRPKEQKEQP